ncbi:LacI family DNA-binding transcriptional regulator [Nonomuraea soli]|uniref:DNA-binding LacI/PurR family transcriptional regulator n=1 Tax=Nonomuraea soli TaxID=1032476 RepID=A0A7W0CSK1_9ACTN|nr:LacI family DNA-binding transcriptional regulator [Nonomuraea soli]MBA2896554.1 DNA-binding LacI/PurR family transcriptional regulator [Nonomuraea soli]
MGKTPVMADVAKEAGVSHQTVSRVLNGHPNVRGETRTRVMAAIDKLGYRRNLTARALATRRSRTLGVVSFDTTLYGPASTVYGISQAARQAGYFVSIVSLKSIDRQHVRDAMAYLGDQGVDGIVVVAPQRAAAGVLADLPRGVPVVAVQGGGADGVPLVRVDHFEGGLAATRHLLELGHQTVWHVRGPTGWIEAEAREEGWRAALSAAGRRIPEPLQGDWSPAAGYRAGRILAEEGASAVFVSNDQMALGLLRAFTELGVDVPGRVSIVGFDDIPESEYFSPPLTTIRQDFAAVGRGSIEQLLRRIEGVETLPPLVVPPVLVVRGSTSGR